MDIGAWFDSRATLRDDFLRCHEAAGSLSHVGEDGAYRRYWRLPRGDGGTQILMETVPAASEIATPGHALHDFVRIGAWLRGVGCHAPAIYALDEAHGYALLEDFGDVSFYRALEEGTPAETVYGLATDVLIHLRAADATALALPDYYGDPVHRNRRRVVDWYMPAVLRRRNPDGLADSYLAAWDAVERALPPCPRGFLHVDYHLQNLMWLPRGAGLQACGILDYQAAMIGPLPYDLVNLLEDARRDVPAAIRAAMRERYCAAMDAASRDVFDQWYKVLAAQFHGRIIGQFVRLAVRDGKLRYLQHLPRLADYLRRELADPLLTPVREWFAGQGIDFTAVLPDDLAFLPALIRPDAV